jgi:hypothetical protein
MDEMPTLPLAVIITLALAWRFARTNQLYVTSLAVQGGHLLDKPFNPRDLRSILGQALLGRRSIQPRSFLIRGIVLAAVALCLLPFKVYAPSLWWLVVALIALYVPWCIAHGMMLDRKTRQVGSR